MFGSKKPGILLFLMQNCAAPPFGGIFCIFWYKTYKDCEINNYQLNHLTKHGKI